MTDHYVRTGAESVRYASMEAIEPDAKEIAYIKYLGKRPGRGQKWVEEELARLDGEAETGELVTPSFETAAWAYSHGSSLRAYGRQSEASAVAQFVALLNEDPEPLTEAEESDTSKRRYKDPVDKLIRRVRDLATDDNGNPVPWPDLIHWCHDGTKEKPGAKVVPAKLYRAIEDKIDEGKAAAAQRKAAAEKKKAEAAAKAAGNAA